MSDWRPEVVGAGTSSQSPYWQLTACAAPTGSVLGPAGCQAGFGLVTGPLTWSIIALRNSLVLHSLDQVSKQGISCPSQDVNSIELLALQCRQHKCVNEQPYSHSAQMTSLFMHASPALVMYALRWYPSQRMIDFAALPAAQVRISVLTVSKHHRLLRRCNLSPQRSLAGLSTAGCTISERQLCGPGGWRHGAVRGMGNQLLCKGEKSGG